MTSRVWVVLLGMGVLLPLGAQDDEKKKVVACTLPIIEALAREVGGEDFEYFSLAKPDQDPHYVSPTPVLQRKLREADLFIEVGLQLELWADLVANDSGKTRLQRGQKGRIIASTGISREQVPSELTRQAGHVHPEGNPHIWLDPLRAKKMATNIAAGLISVAPAKKDAIHKRLKEFHQKIDEALFGKELVEIVGSAELERQAFGGKLFEYLEKEEYEGKKVIQRLGGWLKKGEALRGKKTVEYHQVWTYLAKILGFEIVATIEEKPGIPPGPRHQAEITRRLREDGIAAILVDNFYDMKLPKRLSEETGVPMVALPNQPGGEAGTETYLKFMDYLVNHLVKAVKK